MGRWLSGQVGVQRGVKTPENTLQRFEPSLPHGVNSLPGKDSGFPKTKIHCDKGLGDYPEAARVCRDSFFILRLRFEPGHDLKNLLKI